MGLSERIEKDTPRYCKYIGAKVYEKSKEGCLSGLCKNCPYKNKKEGK